MDPPVHGADLAVCFHVSSHEHTLFEVWVVVGITFPGWADAVISASMAMNESLLLDSSCQVGYVRWRSDGALKRGFADRKSHSVSSPSNEIVVILDKPTVGVTLIILIASPVPTVRSSSIRLCAVS